LKGADTPFGALGDPTSTTAYFVCLYAPGLVFESLVPGGEFLGPFSIPAWSFKGGNTQCEYKNKYGDDGGITSIKLKTGVATKARVQVKGKGTRLPDAMPLTQPVTVQVQNSVGECWEHTFTSPETKYTLEEFKDKEP